VQRDGVCDGETLRGENALTGDVHVAGCLYRVHYLTASIFALLITFAYTTVCTGMKKECGTK
jgi:hypothetical protein